MEMSLMGGGSSTSEIDVAADELEDLLKQITAGLEECAMISDTGERHQKVKALNDKMRRAGNVHHAMKVELQDVEERDQKGYEKKVNDYTRQIARLKQELAAAKNHSEKAHLVAGASPQMDTSQASDSQILDEAQRIQEKDKSATRRMLKMVTGTEELAQNTMSTMQNQTDQLAKIHSDLEEMDSTLKLADAQIKAYMRKMATDKVIMAFLFLIVVGFVSILVIKTYTNLISDDQVKMPKQVQDGASELAGRRLLSAVIGAMGAPAMDSSYIL